MMHDTDFISDRYEILQLLGQGGMGKVHLVFDRETGRNVALKTLLGRSPGGLYRFQREFRSIARLSHPNIVRVYNYGLLEDSPYFTMEYVDGCTLREYLSEWDRPYRREDPRHRQRLIRTCKIFSQICSALYYIHSHGLIHRDIKPGNIMVSTEESAKLMDFGLARDIESSLALTRTGAILGTVAYMSPEQCRGVSLDARSDLYSLGVVIYELMAGRKPFAGERPVEVLYKHVEEIPVAASSANPMIPDEIDRMIGRLLMKDPAERFQNALELRQRWDEYHSLITDETISVDLSDTAADTTRHLELFLRPQFIGRAEEKDKLGHLTDAVENGRPAIAMISGAIGSGKSRLVEECIGRARVKDIKVFITRCFPGENIPYRTMSDFMDAVSAYLWKKDEDEQRAILRDDGKVLARVFPGFLHLAAVQGAPEPPMLKGPDERIRLFQAVRDFIHRLAETQPLIIVFDNLQWADPDGLDMLAFVCESMRGSLDHSPAVLEWTGIIGIYRSDELTGEKLPQEFLKRIGSLDIVLNIRMAALSFQESQQMIQSVLSAESPPRQLCQWMFAQTGGNPLFIEEMLKNFLEQGVLFKKRSRWVMTLHDGKTVSADMSSPDYERLPISQNIRELIIKRLDSIGPDAKRLLEWAAVAGKQFTVDLLHETAFEDMDILLDMLNELINHRVILERRRIRDEYFEFDQALIQEIAYESMTVSRRHLYHRRFAEVYEQRVQKSDYIQELARHWQASDQPFRAPPYLVEAGKKARAVYAHAQAIRVCTQVIDIVQNPRHHDKVDHAYELFIDALNMRGDSLDNSGMLQAALNDYQTVLETAKAQSDQYNIARAYNKTASIYWMRGQLKDAIDATEKSLEIWQILGNMGPYFMCVKNLGLFHQRLGDTSKALQYYNLALEKSRELNNKSIRVSTLNDLGNYLIESGRPAEAVSYFREYWQIAREDQKKMHMVRAWANLSHASFLIGSNDESLSINEDARRLAEEIDYKLAQAVILSNNGLVLRWTGRLDEARQAHEESLQMARDIEDRSLVADNLFRLGQDLFIQGACVQGTKLVRDAADEFRTMETFGNEFEPRFELHEMLVFMGFYDSAIQEFDRLLFLAQETKNPRFLLMSDIARLKDFARRSPDTEISRQATEIIERLSVQEKNIETIRDVESSQRIAAWWLWKLGFVERSLAIRRRLLQQIDCRNEIGALIDIIFEAAGQLIETGETPWVEDWTGRFANRVQPWKGALGQMKWNLIRSRLLAFQLQWEEACSLLEPMLESVAGVKQQMSEIEYVSWIHSDFCRAIIETARSCFQNTSNYPAIDMIRMNFD